MSEPTPGALSAGQVFHGRYEIVRCLKAGGMGAVYECIHLKTRKHRALKVILPQMLAEAGMLDRFELEARVTAEIESEHIVETFDAGVDEVTGASFLVMELLRGEDLASVMARRGPLPAGETIVLLAQAALALDRTHAAGIVHRDLKPDNLFLTRRDDGSPRLKILDFGIAKLFAGDRQSVPQTAMIGTPLYMSPEQILGEGSVGPAADVYAMGHIAFALLTGDAYWADEQRASPALFTFFGKVMAGVPEPATMRASRRGVALPAAFDAWFAQATAQAGSARFEGASTLVHELAAALGISAPRLASLPFMFPEPSGPDSSVASSTTMLAETAVGAEPFSSPAPTLSDGATVLASSKSIKASGSIPRPSRARGAMIGLGALGLAGLGLFVVSEWSPTPSPGESPATTTDTPADPLIAETSAPAPGTASAPIVAPAPTSSAAAPPATATLVQGSPRPRPAPTRPPPARPVAPISGCNPPYVTTSSGLRVMKRQCL